MARLHGGKLLFDLSDKTDTLSRQRADQALRLASIIDRSARRIYAEDRALAKPFWPLV